MKVKISPTVISQPAENCDRIPSSDKYIPAGSTSMKTSGMSPNSIVIFDNCPKCGGGTVSVGGGVFVCIEVDVGIATCVLALVVNVPLSTSIVCSIGISCRNCEHAEVNDNAPMIRLTFHHFMASSHFLAERST
jgi:hypothetical protein